MKTSLSRRHLLKSAAVAPLLTSAAASLAADSKWTPGAGMPQEGPTTPKIGAPVNIRNVTDQAMRAVKQVGVNYVLSGGGPMPWTVEQLSPLVEN